MRGWNEMQLCQQPAFTTQVWWEILKQVEPQGNGLLPGLLMINTYIMFMSSWMQILQMKEEKAGLQSTIQGGVLQCGQSRWLIWSTLIQLQYFPIIEA